MRVEPVGEGDLAELLPLMRAYCDFYEATPPDEALETLARSLIDDPDREGIQLIARDDEGSPLGFATVFWTWQTLNAARAGVMNDLFVLPEARGRGIGRELIEECRRRSRQHGAAELVWETAPDNEVAQRLYRSLGAREESWISFAVDA
ncbi:MAG: GNAT family N-acetyltransferase [Actinomycetota bacterium]